MKDAIIDCLRKSAGYASGEDISRQLKISRAGIWKNIEELRKDGYEIVAVPHLGYKLNGIPDKLLPREVAHGLGTAVVGSRVLHFESLASTMDVAFQLGVEDEPEGAVVCAETQTRGRGRMERRWSSPKGKGVYFSLLLRPNLLPTDAAKMTLLSAVAVCEALREVSGLDVHIKWPNDLLVQGKKLAGILMELSAEMDRVRFIVVGLGLNVNTAQRQLPPQATSLKLQTGTSVDRIAVMQAVLRSLDHWYAVLNGQGFDPVIKRWRELSSTLGQKISIGDIIGTAVDLDEHGGLIVQDKDGQRVRCMTGDVQPIT
ncbi:MAG: biotin--[acetyl-CoA-carboxylase] ligase [Candidatus Omnitrophica bacterium]|nr:biotin--[acetyl-CoA-carboxylase] ligase [Candidatus Omnitrophota bacterium]MCB9720512.1 biotin--[acetyl-CoA-carboxylase] ligase [Candidatus Omnitrophota bacterium]